MGDFLLSRLMFPLAWAGCPVLALVGLGCVFLCEGKSRRLAWAAGVFIGAMVLYFGGNVLLGFFHLTWRNLPSLILCGALLVSGWAGIILTVNCLMPQEMPGLAPFLRRILKAGVLFFAGVVLFVTVWFGPMLLAFAYGSRDQMVDYQGQRLVERMEGFLGPDYSYYVYHGPLVRGTERIWIGPTHIYGDIG